MDQAYKLLKRTPGLTAQQRRTIAGQIRAGDLAGALKGIKKTACLRQDKRPRGEMYMKSTQEYHGQPPDVKTELLDVALFSGVLAEICLRIQTPTAREALLENLIHFAGVLATTITEGGTPNDRA